MAAGTCAGAAGTTDAHVAEAHPGVTEVLGVQCTDGLYYADYVASAAASPTAAPVDALAGACASDGDWPFYCTEAEAVAVSPDGTAHAMGDLYMPDGVSMVMDGTYAGDAAACECGSSDDSMAMDDHGHDHDDHDDSMAMDDDDDDDALNSACAANVDAFYACLGVDQPADDDDGDDDDDDDGDDDWSPASCADATAADSLFWSHCEVECAAPARLPADACALRRRVGRYRSARPPEPRLPRDAGSALRVLAAAEGCPPPLDRCDYKHLQRCCTLHSASCDGSVEGIHCASIRAPVR